MTTRREFLRYSAMTTAGVLAARHSSPAASQNPQVTPALTGPPAGFIQTMRAAGANTPIQTTKLTDTIFLLQGVGGNMVAQTGADGKLLIDSSVATASRAIVQALAKLGPSHLRLLINTHWHFDHTDGNAALHEAGAFIIAQENTRLRLSSPQSVKLLNLSFPASPNSALPQLTFPENDKLYFDNDELDLVHTPDAHTDSDIFIHFVNANVIHTGDLWFSGSYPLIDEDSGGTINGMMRAVDQILSTADDKTKLVPGHGPLGDKRALQKYREMLATVAGRIEKLKISGQSLQQVIAAKPTAEFDATLGHGMMTPELFVTVIYNTL
jgi:cyclase